MAKAVCLSSDDGADSSEVPDLRVQRVISSGEPVWPDNGILITDQFTSANVAIPNPAVSDGAGGAIILYSDSTGAKLQRVSSQGSFGWNEGVKLFPVGRQMIPDGSGGAIVAGVRQGLGSVSLKYIVGAQRVDSSGQILWGDKGVSITELADDLTRSVDMVIDKDGNSIFVWHDKRTGTFDIYAQKLNINGEPQWSQDGVNVSSFQSSKTNFFAGIASDQLSGAA
ncbi:MAG: hypothetical protein ACE5IR_10905 [bacterium]